MIIRDLPAEECRAGLSQSTFGRLACCHEGQPYIVPLHFAVEGGFVYSFSMPGQKVAWMRENPRVCLEVESVVSQTEWTTIIALGDYEELPDTPAYQPGRPHAREVLQRRVTWWEPGAVAVTGHVVSRDATPVFYRIWLAHLTGRRGVPAPDEAPAAPPAIAGGQG